MEDNRISIRQFLIIFAVAALSPATRMMPVVTANTAKHAGWVSVLISMLGLFAIFAVFSGIFSRGKNGPAGFGDAFECSFGRIPAKILMLVYILWTGFLYLLYVRYYAERMLSTIFTTTDIRFFIGVMMVMVFIALRGRVKVLARFSEMSILVFTLVLIMIIAGLLPRLEIKNIWPVTHLDTVPVLKASFQIIGAHGIVTLFFFFGEFVEDKNETWKQGRRVTVVLGLVLTVITALCIGTMSYRITASTPMPFFTAAKLISIVEPLDRIEALLFSVWVISDFVIITSLAVIICSIAKRIFGVSETRYFAAPLAIFGYVGGLAMASSVFELEGFSKSMSAPVVNLCLCYIIPLLTLIVGKIRRRL